MNYTKEQLQGMSNLELSQTLTVFEAGKPWVEYAELMENDRTFHLADPVGNPFFLDVEDISDWNYLMPLAVKYQICLLSSPNTSGNKWSAIWNDAGGKWSVNDVSFYDEDPQRAIACCLILVLQEKQNEN